MERVLQETRRGQSYSPRNHQPTLRTRCKESVWISSRVAAKLSEKSRTSLISVWSRFLLVNPQIRVAKRMICSTSHVYTTTDPYPQASLRKIQVALPRMLCVRWGSNLTTAATATVRGSRRGSLWNYNDNSHLPSRCRSRCCFCLRTHDLEISITTIQRKLQQAKTS